MDFLKIFINILIGVLGTILIFVFWLYFIALYNIFYLEPFCLQAGFTQSKVTVNLQKYCIVRINQTDQVVPYHVILDKIDELNKKNNK